MESENKFWRDIFEDSPELIAIFSGEKYNISYANKSYQKLFPKRKLLAKNVANVLPEIEQQGFIILMDGVRITGKHIHKKEVLVEIDYNNSGKTEKRYFNFTYRPIREKKEELRSIVLHAVDITNQVKKRFKAEEEIQFMNIISDTIPEHVWVVLLDGKIEFINESGLSFYGMKSISSLNTLEKLVHKEERLEFKKKMDTAFSEMEKFNMEFRIKNGKGEYCWHMLRIRPMIDEKGLLAKLVASSSDINEQKVSQKNKDDFMGVASHELKTPLTSVKAYTQLLYNHVIPSKDEVALNYLDKTNSSVEKLEKFVSDLLDISRIQSGRLTLQRSIISMVDLVKDVVDNLQLTSKSHKITFTKSANDIKLLADPSRIEQVVINLVNNAIKYSPDADEVIVSIIRKINNVEVSIQDFGLGISSNDINNVFDRYYRVAEHENKVSGMGIGLNISKEIIHLHDGSIWVESALKKGSIFYFSLPLKED